MAVSKPTIFKNSTFIAECVETHMGQRFVVYRHPHNTVYDIKNAALYSPYTMASFAAWTVKAAEWVADSPEWTKQITKREKKKKKKKEQPCLEK